MKGNEGTRRASPGRLIVARVALLTLAAAFIAIGVWRGEASTVLQKAIRICLECIGIG